MSLLNALAWNVPSLFAARLLTGVGLSGMTVVAMTYIGEMFPSRVRGAFQARILMFGLMGIPATAYVARFMSRADWGWRAVFVWGSMAVFFPLFARRLEESPRWLERRGRVNEAEQVLARIELEESNAIQVPLPPSRAHRRPDPLDRGEESIGLRALIRSGAGGRVVLLTCVWFCQTLGFYGFNNWVPTLLAENGFSIARTLEQLVGDLRLARHPGAWIASMIADRWERKSLIAIVAVLAGTFGMIYGLSFNTWIIVIFGFLVAMSQQMFAPLLYAYTAECFPTDARNTGTGLSYGVGRLGNAFGPLIVAFLFMNLATAACSRTSVCWVLVALLISPSDRA